MATFNGENAAAPRRQDPLHVTELQKPFPHSRVRLAAGAHFMRRLGRIILGSLTIIAMIAWLCVSVLWIRSHWRGDSYLHNWTTGSWLVLSGDGGLGFAMDRHPPPKFGGGMPSGRQTNDSPSYPKPGFWATGVAFSTTYT